MLIKDKLQSVYNNMLTSTPDDISGLILEIIKRKDLPINIFKAALRTQLKALDHLPVNEQLLLVLLNYQVE